MIFYLPDFMCLYHCKVTCSTGYFQETLFRLLKQLVIKISPLNGSSVSQITYFNILHYLHPIFISPNQSKKRVN